MNRIVIAAPASGSGKTTVTLGIMAALTKRGMNVAPFKVGPDFIDPGYHGLVTGRRSINLDGWICGHDFIRDTFSLHADGADIAVIEGVMGLFDGIDAVNEAGSTAEMAKLIETPVVLVVDARSQARSAAALVHGFATFDPGVKLAGVVFNNVASANHERLLVDALAAYLPNVAVIGCLPKDPALSIPSRHLGLCTAEDNPLSEEFLSHLVEMMERHLDLDLFLRLASTPPPLTGVGRGVGEASGFTDGGTFPHPLPPSREGRGECDGKSVPVRFTDPGALRPLPFKGRDRVGMGSSADSTTPAPLRIAVARDAAFCFMYQDNLRLLEEQGAELCYFSPLQDPLPAGISGIYLPGGYPELFAERLAANEQLKEQIAAAVESGMPVYAECGGFIYLTRGVEADGALHPFVGIFPVATRMLPRRKALGYREVALLQDSVIGKEGVTARGHEFHYSEMEEMPETVERVYGVSRKGESLGREGYRYRNCLASYIHLHFGSSPPIAKSFAGHCRSYRAGSQT